MPKYPTKNRVVLALFPVSSGYGFAVFQSTHRSLDWGKKLLRKHKSKQTLKRFKDLIDEYKPDALALPDFKTRMGPRSPRMQELFEAIERIAKRRRLVVAHFSRRDIQATFRGIGAKTKFEIAHAIAGQMPDFELWLPQKRKIWEDKDARMLIFDAASLAFTFFHFQRKER